MMKKRTILPVLLLFCLLLSGCRTRIADGGPADLNSQTGKAEETQESRPGFQADGGTEENRDAGEQEKNGDSGGQTRENPEASRKEYDETRPAEILPGTERTVHGGGEGDGASADGEDPENTAAKLKERAEQTATRTVPAEDAEQKGISEDAEAADSAMTYYTVLLETRTGSLFECQRLTVYWETAEDHVTIFKTSPEHSMILNAGAYDVSSRLLEENLRVDDGWIGRKNPGVIVKTVNRRILGTGVSSAGTARKVYTELLSRPGWAETDAVRNRRVLLLSEELLETPYFRVAAMLMIARTANAVLFTDVDMDQALGMLAEESSGSIPGGIYYFDGQGGF